MPRKRRDRRRPKSTWFPKRAARDAFLSIPEDVFHMICELLDLPDILRLVCTNSHFAKFERSLLMHNDLVRKEHLALCWACGHGDLDLAEKCLKMGYDPNHSDATHGDDGSWLQIRAGQERRWSSEPKILFIRFSIIAQAIIGDKTEMLSLLHRYGANIASIPFRVKTRYHESDFKDLTPLHLAQSPQMIRKIITLVPDISVDSRRDVGGRPILSWFIHKGMNSQGIQYLLEAGAHPDARQSFEDPYGRTKTPLEVALCRLDSGAVKVLLDWGASLEDDRGIDSTKSGLFDVLTTSLFQSDNSKEQSKEILGLLVAHSKDTGSSTDRIRFFRYAVKYGSPDFVRFLVNTGAYSYNLMPQDHEQVPKSMSPAPAGLNTTLWILKQIERCWVSSIGTRVFLHDPDILLENLKVLLDFQPQQPAWDAMYTYALRNIKMLFLEEILRVINFTRSSFQCPWSHGALARLLHRGSALRGHLGQLHSCVLLLLQTGANVNNFHNGKTALHRAFSLTIESPRESDDMDVEPRMVCHDVDGEIYDANDLEDDVDLSAAEHTAVRQDHVLSIILSLLLNQADPMAEDDEKKTPVWYAERNGWLDLDLPKAAVIREMIHTKRWAEVTGDRSASFNITGWYEG